MIAKRVHFDGYVQGVGFRYTTRSLARKYNVTGYVMNLPDGGVELFVEGDEADVAGLIESVRSEMRQYIRSADVQDVPATGTYTQFVIRYY